MNIQSFFETINELLLFHIFSYGILETCTGCLNYKEHIHAEFSTCGLFVCLFIFRFLEHKYSFNIKTYNICFFFSIRVFFHEHWRLTRQQGKGGDRLLFHSTTSTRSRTFRHLFRTLQVRWLSHIFKCTACIYQTATRWHLPPYRITIYLIDDLRLSFVCLRDNLILAFCYKNLRQETDGFELASTITLILQANRLTKCASHNICDMK